MLLLCHSWTPDEKTGLDQTADKNHVLNSGLSASKPMVLEITDSEVELSHLSPSPVLLLIFANSSLYLLQRGRHTQRLHVPQDHFLLHAGVGFFPDILSPVTNGFMLKKKKEEEEDLGSRSGLSFQMLSAFSFRREG